MLQVAMLAVIFVASVECGVPACAQSEAITHQIHASPQFKEPTVEQFREYLDLSGVGESWRATWIASLTPVWNQVAAPYWPEDFKRAIEREMKSADLAPSVWNVYRAVYTSEEIHSINLLLREKGIPGYLASAEGSEFCAKWAGHEEEGHREVATLTQTTIFHVYDRYKPEIKAARAKYLATHPNYKD